MFTDSPGRTYANGDFAFYDCIDIDEFSVHELNGIVKELGITGKNIMYYSFLRPDMNLDKGLYALGNDDDVRKMADYIRLGYKMIEVFIEHEKTTVYTYIDAAYNTPSKRCVIVELPETVTPKNAAPSKKKPRKEFPGSCYKKLMLGWKDNDVNEFGEGSSNNLIGESSQPKSTIQSDFVEDFYSGLDEFDPFDGLDSEPVAATTHNECVGKSKGVALDDNQVYDEMVQTEGENRDGESSDSPVFVDEENELVDVAVNMDDFDTTNAKTMGNEDTTVEEGLGNEDTEEDINIDIGVDGIDNEEFESASDDDAIDRIRKRKLKHLKKQSDDKDGGLHKVHFFVGQEFTSAAEVKDMVHKHSIETRRSLYFKKNDKVRVRAELCSNIVI